MPPGGALEAKSFLGGWLGINRHFGESSNASPAFQTRRKWRNRIFVLERCLQSQHMGRVSVVSKNAVQWQHWAYWKTIGLQSWQGRDAQDTYKYLQVLLPNMLTLFKMCLHSVLTNRSTACRFITACGALHSPPGFGGGAVPRYPACGTASWGAAWPFLVQN